MTSNAVKENGHESKTKVFISYSRKDIEFADRMDAALKSRGFEPLIDRTEILAFEAWWQRVEVLIGRADTVVFVLSPDAVRPESIARKEVAFATSLNKRFAPIVFRPVEDKLVSEELAKLNFIFFDDQARFEQSADQLAKALNTDIGWIRHTPTWVTKRGGERRPTTLPGSYCGRRCWNRRSGGSRRDPAAHLRLPRRRNGSSEGAAKERHDVVTFCRAV